MNSDPNAPDTSQDRSPSMPGEPKVRERYNTNYIVDNFTRQERRNRIIVAALAATLALSLGLGLLLSGRSRPAPAPVATDTQPTDGSSPPPAEPAH